jgi:ATP-dependent DNA ligase
MQIPVKPPLAPMEALLQDEIPSGPHWQYEPKWDGFRCLFFRDGAEVYMQSKAGQPLARYFPDLTEAAQGLKASRFVLDGEIAVPVAGKLDFDQLLLRIHPAASRVQKLAHEHPAIFIVFDILVDAAGESLISKPLVDRRTKLEQFAKAFLSSTSLFRISPATRDLAEAQRWFGISGADLDGILAKRLDMNYRSGERTAMVKIKPRRTVDCVIGGFRYDTGKKGVGSVLLGLYDQAGQLNHVGFCSSFKATERRALLPKLEALIQPPGFTGRAPGGPSRWNAGQSLEWQPLKPELVIEIGYDHFTGGRFRHGTKLIRWRPDKAPRQCLMDQVTATRAGSYALLSKNDLERSKKKK